MRVTYDLFEEPKGPVYRDLIAASLRYCNVFLLVVRHTIELQESGKRTLESLRPFLISQTEEAEWPGTQLLGETATIFRFSLSRDAAILLGEVADSLYSWIQPDLPEDLCLIRLDGSPWLVTIAHEREGYLVLLPEEMASLATEIPGLRLSRPSH